MKKAIAILLSLTMILVFAACGNSASQTEQPSTEDTSVESKAYQICGKQYRYGEYGQSRCTGS